MTKTIKIEGMMCAHCEKHVKDALEKVSGVVSAAVSHENGSAVVTLSSPVDDCVDVLMIAKYLERIGDHAVNICEWTEFNETGVVKNIRLL